MTATPRSAAEPVSVKNNPEPTNKIANGTDYHYRLEIVWKNVILLTIMHIFCIYGVWMMITQAKRKTIIFTFIYLYFSIRGTGAGVHRLWAHRTYKAKLPLRIMLMLDQCIAMQNSIYEWVRDHRVHHKFTDTDADPHNSKRGFFFSHMGWLMVRKHRDVFRKGKTVDLSDLEADPVVMFQKKYYVPLSLSLSILIPIAIPCYFWNEELLISTGVTFARYILSLHGTWLVNSAAHIYGMRPYDRNINPTENKIVSAITFGEGWHNYHHIFPWDYKAAELGNYRLNLATAFLDLMAKIGWAYDLKTVSPEMVKKRAQRTGDGTWKENGSKVSDYDEDRDHHFHCDHVWGWGDKDMKEDDIADIRNYNKLTE